MRKYQEEIFEGIKGELHHDYRPARHGEYSFSCEEYCKTSFLKGANNIAIFLKSTDQNNGLAPSEKSDFLDFENGDFCSLKGLIFLSTTVFNIISGLFSRTINKEVFFCVPKSWVISFGKIGFGDFETSFNIFSGLNQFSLIPGPYNEIC